MNGFRIWALQDLSYILPVKTLQVLYVANLSPINKNQHLLIINNRILIEY